MHDSNDSSQNRWLPVWRPDSSFEERYKSNYDMACAWSNSITKDFYAAQEAVNNAFIALKKRMDCGGDMSCIEFKTVLRYKSIDLFRTMVRRRKIVTPASEFDKADQDGKIVPFLENVKDKSTLQPQQAAERHDDAAFIETIRAFLTEMERTIFDCKREDLTDKDTALRLGITEEAVKQRWKRIKRKLCKSFGTDFNTI